ASAPMAIEVRSALDVDTLEVGGAALELREQPAPGPGRNAQASAARCYETPSKGRATRATASFERRRSTSTSGACRFYASMGGRLASVDRAAYPGQPGIEHEVRLDWVFE